MTVSFDELKGVEQNLLSGCGAGSMLMVIAKINEVL